tara:strand:- start:2720 stop:4024 length:1305 start_codon:yes stop_codon:yes gene_type:complete
MCSTCGCKSAEYKKGTKGPCWDGYTYVGDTPYSKGSCVKNADNFEADENIMCDKYYCSTQSWTTPPPMKRYTNFYGDDEYEFYACRHCGNNTEEKLIEVKPFDDNCYMCDKNALYTVEDLPTGAKSFCSELCYCNYAGLPYNGEGYYGLTDKSKVKEPAYVALARRRISKKSESFSAEKRVNWKTFPKSDEEYDYRIHWKSPIPAPGTDDFFEHLRNYEESMEPYDIEIEQYIVIDDKIVIYLVSFYESIVTNWDTGEYKYGRKKHWAAFSYQCEIPFSKYVELWQEHEEKYEKWYNLKIKAESLMKDRLSKDGGNTITVAMSRELHEAYKLEPKFKDRLVEQTLSKNKASGIIDRIPNYVNSNEYNSMSKSEVKKRILEAVKEFLAIEPEWIISPYEKMAKRKLMAEYNSPKPYLIYGGLMALAGLALFKRKR